MQFEIIWTKESKKSMGRLQREDVIRIIKKVESIKSEPQYFLKKLVGERAWRLRVGDWRVIIDIDNDNKRLYILEVGHRKNVYKNL